MEGLNEKVAIVTGGGAGLGRSHSLLLARHGARVLVNDLSERSSAVVEEIVAAGGDAIAHQGSVTDETDVMEMVGLAIEKWGKVDILVNNAGVLRDKTFAKMSLEDFREVLEVHVMGAVICTKAVWGGMRERSFGRIVMTTSSSGLYGSFGQSNYGTAKMALVGLMQTLSLEGEKYNIKVNCLAPTAATSMLEGLLPAEMQKLLAPEKVSPALIPLVGDEAPTRTIVCAGAGHFERAYITLTSGHFVGSVCESSDQVSANWDQISDRSQEFVPEYGRMQVEQELRAAGYVPSEKESG